MVLNTLAEDVITETFSSSNESSFTASHEVASQEARKKRLSMNSAVAAAAGNSIDQHIERTREKKRLLGAD